MKIYPEPKKDLTNLLKASQQDFEFDQQSIKDELFSHLPTQEDLAGLKHGFFTFRTLKISGVVAVVVIFTSGTFALAATAKPGDKLFGLNKFGENVILHLPLSADQKAQLQTYVVTKRLQALKQLGGVTLANDEVYNRKLETVKESDRSLKSAIETITANKNRFAAAGETESAGRMEIILIHLNDLAQEHEDQIQAIENQFPEGTSKETIKQNLMEIKTTHRQARVELHLEMENQLQP